MGYEKRVVTGASGYLGQQLISRLERDDSVDRIIGISRRAPKVASSSSSSIPMIFASRSIRYLLRTISIPLFT